MKKLTTSINCLCAACALALLSACSSAIDEQGYTNDPLEPMNRGVYAFNDSVDKAIVKPVAKTYTYVVPNPVRKGVGNFFGNLDDINSLANAILQLDGDATAGLAARVIDNTVFGIGGIFDVASHMDAPKISKDFGSTLAHYGVKSGPFLMLPFIGPTTLRDGIAKIPNSYLTPIHYVNDTQTYWGLVGTKAIHTRASFFPLEEKMENATTDKYSSIRDGWLQYRWNQLGTPITDMQQNEIDAVFAPNGQSF